MRITIIDDCSDIDYSPILTSFINMIDINYIRLSENRGSGYARQFALDNTCGKYVMFIDSDDALYNKYSVKLLIDDMRNKCSDISTGSFIREMGNETCPLVKCTENSTWIWGRVYLREFLIKNNIRFSDQRLNEDVSFILTCLLYAEMSYIKETVYVWNYNKLSLTRNPSGDYPKLGMTSFVDNLILAHKERLSRGLTDSEKSKRLVCNGLAVCYWYLVEMFVENPSACEEYLMKVNDFFNCSVPDYDDFINSDCLKDAYFASLKSMNSISNTYIPRFTFWDFLNDLYGNSKSDLEIANNGKYEFG